MSILIKLLKDGCVGHAAIESRKYTYRFHVSGLTCNTPPIAEILPTTTSSGLFPLPGSFPSALPNNDGAPTTLPDGSCRVTDVRIEKVMAGGTQAMVAMDMESRIGSFDQSGSFLLDMRITSAIEYIQSNYDVTTGGLRNALAKVRYLSTLFGNSTVNTRLADLSIPRNRKTVSIVQLEPAGFHGGQNAKTALCSFVNSTTFWGGAPRTWLCTALESQWEGFPDKPFHTTYQFVYNPDEWTGVAYFNDQSLNLPMNNITAPANFDPGTESASPYGCKVFRISGESDFNTLNLPDITTIG